MSDRPCMLNAEKWRVRRLVKPNPVAVWAIWPPQWDIEQAPLLVFPKWPMAFRAAFARAQFFNAPPTPSQEVSNVLHAPLMEDINGQA